MRKSFTWLVGTVFLISIVSWAMGDGNITADSLARGVLAKSCRERSHAIESFIKSSGTVSLRSLRTELMKVSPLAANYLKDVFEFLESLNVAFETVMDTLMPPLKP